MILELGRGSYLLLWENIRGLFPFDTFLPFRLSCFPCVFEMLHHSLAKSVPPGSSYVSGHYVCYANIRTKILSLKYSVIFACIGLHIFVINSRVIVSISEAWYYSSQSHRQHDLFLLEVASCNNFFFACFMEFTFSFLNLRHKKLKEEDISICECKYDPCNPESACGESCLNLLTSTECTSGYCPCGEHCRNQVRERID